MVSLQCFFALLHFALGLEARNEDYFSSNFDENQNCKYEDKMLKYDRNKENPRCVTISQGIKQIVIKLFKILHLV